MFPTKLGNVKIMFTFTYPKFGFQKGGGLFFHGKKNQIWFTEGGDLFPGGLFTGGGVVSLQGG